MTFLCFYDMYLLYSPAAAGVFHCIGKSGIIKCYQTLMGSYRLLLAVFFPASSNSQMALAIRVMRRLAFITASGSDHKPVNDTIDYGSIGKEMPQD